MASRSEVKIIYYGPGVSGCTTNMLYLASQIAKRPGVISYHYEYFKFTRVSFPRLKNRGMPGNLVDSLTCLQNQTFRSEEAFWKAIQDIIGKEQTTQYRDLILWQAHIAGRVSSLNIESHDFHYIGLESFVHFISKLGLYSPPFSIYLDPLRRELLDGIDGMIFVADSQKDLIPRNIHTLEELEENLRSYGNTLASLSWVVQYNKRDLPNILPVEELEEHINRYHVPYVEAIAPQGIGVVESLTTLLRVIEKNPKIRYW